MKWLEIARQRRALQWSGKPIPRSLAALLEDQERLMQLNWDRAEMRREINQPAVRAYYESLGFKFSPKFRKKSR